MSLKYNSRALLEDKLAILKCCIGTKGIELSDKIALALGDTDCLTKELEILNKYYDILSCYYPYDCYIIANEDLGCGEIEVLETNLFTIDNPSFIVIRDWIVAEDELEIIVYNVLTGTTINVPYPYLPGTTILNLIGTWAAYVRATPSTLGYTVTDYRLNPPGEPPFTYSFVLTVDNCSVEGDIWGMGIYNVTQDTNIVFESEMNNDSICQCDEECCNVKIIPEVLEYELDTPQVLETKTFSISSGLQGTISGYITAGQIDRVRIYNSLLGTTILLPLGSMITTSTTVGELFDIIVNYINTNRFSLGYTISYITNPGTLAYDFTMVALDCNLDYAPSPFWGFDLYVTFTGSPIASRSFSVLDTSTCAEYTTTVIHPETAECQENCLTDDQVEKIIRNAMSLCECCSDIYLNNNLE